ncbi:MAG: hypothetical protein OEV44_13685, partial [Spirochaetota bacterium]|nr:hypothetical protein [Spirochaetota bacterium]
FLEQKKDLTNETSYNTLLHNNIDKLFTSSNVLTLNGTSIYYSFYESDNKSNKKIFSNVIVSQSDKENPNYNQIYLFKEANLINNKIILRDLKETISTHDNITKKPSLPVELDINHFINRFRSKEKVFSPPIESKEPSKKIKENLENQITFPLMVENEDSLIKSALVKSFNFDIINNYENYLNLQIVNVKNILAGDKIGGSWLKLLNFIIEIISIILILLAIGVIISTKNVPLLNFISSMITTTLLLIGLAYYFPLPEKIIKLISTEISFLPGIIVPGIVLIISSVLLILIAYIKYRNIKFTSGEGK